jgi:hypothetical protein
MEFIIWVQRRRVPKKASSLLTKVRDFSISKSTMLVTRRSYVTDCWQSCRATVYLFLFHTAHAPLKTVEIVMLQKLFTSFSKIKKLMCSMIIIITLNRQSVKMQFKKVFYRARPSLRVEMQKKLLNVTSWRFFSFKYTWRTIFVEDSYFNEILRD